MSDINFPTSGIGVLTYPSVEVDVEVRERQALVVWDTEVTGFVGTGGGGLELSPVVATPVSPDLAVTFAPMARVQGGGDDGFGLGLGAKVGIIHGPWDVAVPLSYSFFDDGGATIGLEVGRRDWRLFDVASPVVGVSANQNGAQATIGLRF